MKYLILLVAIGVTLAKPMVAQGSSPAPCDTVSTTLQMRQCASQRLERARTDLVKYLAEARRLTSNVKLLDSVQVAWERFRDVECRAAAAEYEGGTMQPLVVLACLEGLTRERTRHLYNDYIGTSDSALPKPEP
jgi:uncharacterized protein YecT (DUF1311 family)